MKTACMSGHQNTHIFENVWSFQGCQVKCEAESGCKSVDYHKKDYVCYLSKESSKTAPKDFHQPCYTEPEMYEYAEIIGPTGPEPGKLNAYTIIIYANFGVLFEETKYIWNHGILSWACCSLLCCSIILYSKVTKSPGV